MRVPDTWENREIVLQKVQDLLTELDAGIVWENDQLPRFLGAFGALLGSIENAYVNTSRPVPEDAWSVIADALDGARYYE